MTSIVPSLCNGCVHLQPGGTTCEAFPAGIPQDLLTAGGDHHAERPGDHGIRFELDRAHAAAVEAFEQWRRTFGSS